MAVMAFPWIVGADKKSGGGRRVEGAFERALCWRLLQLVDQPRLPLCNRLGHGQAVVSVVEDDRLRLGRGRCKGQGAFTRNVVVTLAELKEVGLGVRGAQSCDRVVGCDRRAVAL